jgi:hypothetical protein
VMRYIPFALVAPQCVIEYWEYAVDAVLLVALSCINHLLYSNSLSSSSVSTWTLTISLHNIITLL